MKTASVIYFSDRLETYADAIIAILVAYPTVERIEIVFTDGSLAPKNRQDDPSIRPTIGAQQEEITSAIRKRINGIKSEHSHYNKADEIQIIPKPVHGHELYRVLRSSSVIDVSATPKEMAINLVTAAIAQGTTPVCSMQWCGKLDRRRNYFIGTDEHEYEDLTKLREAKRLGRYYRSNVFIVYFIAVSVFLLAVVSFLSYWMPQFKIASQILNSLGVMIGFVSLWLATRASRDD